MILISGVNGFVGHHLAEVCSDQGGQITGIGYGELAEESPLKHLLANYTAVDLTDSESVNQSVNFENVQTVYHLAGLAAVGPSFEQPARYLADNTAMLINLAEKALKDKSTARFIIISSGAIYDPAQDLPIGEDGKLLSNSPYAISKVASELFCDYYRSRGLDMIIARPFNHIGPGQAPGFIVPDLAEQAREYNNTGTFKVGNLATKRDYTDVRDVVSAYVCLAKALKLNHALYNVCSGQSYSGETILQEICKVLSIDNPKIEVNESKLRPNDIMDIRGDSSRLKADTGWTPQISIEQSIKDFISSSEA